MPDEGYGVLVGTLTADERDRPDNQGRWYRVLLSIDVAGARYKAAVDVDSHQSATGVQGKVVPPRNATCAHPGRRGPHLDNRRTWAIPGTWAGPMLSASALGTPPLGVRSRHATAGRPLSA
ncbi:MAG: hypothetical protein QM695_16560 [Micropruina sp.]